MKLNQTTLRFLLIAMLLLLLLNFPLLATANKQLLHFGIPNLYLYVFVVWLLVIVLAWLLANKAKQKQKQEGQHE